LRTYRFNINHQKIFEGHFCYGHKGVLGSLKVMELLNIFK
jgi:hypothetical protein